MASFFSNLNLTRLIILLSLVGSVVLAYLGWQAESRRSELEDALNHQVPLLVADIQAKSHQHTRLVQNLEGEGFKGVAEAGAYIRRIAEGDDLGIGFVEIDESEKQVTRNIKDRVFTIEPTDKTRRFSRDMIASFLYELEKGSRRVKVTNIDIELAKEKGRKKVANYDVPEEGWTFSAAITVRQEDSDTTR